MSTEAEAVKLGWVPKEKFRGDEKNFIDAETFLERGKQMIPIIKRNNEKLETQLSQVTSENEKLKEQLAEQGEAISELRVYNSKQALNTVKRNRDEIKKQLIQAKKDENIEAEVELSEQLAEHTQAIKDAEGEVEDAEAPPKKGKEKAAAAGDDTSANPVNSKEFRAWEKDNDWFGKDRRKTALMTAIAQEMREDPEYSDLSGRAFLDAVTDALEAETGVSKPDKVGGSEHGGEASVRGKKGAKSYNALPQEAKEACERQGKKLVGPGKTFKTMAEWQSKYAQDYFAEEV